MRTCPTNPRGLLLPVVSGLCLLALLSSPPQVARAQELGEQRILLSEWVADYAARRDSIINFYAHRERGGYYEVAARLYRGQDIPWARASLDTLMQNPSGDMFWMVPFVLVTYLGREHLPEAYQQRMRELWRTYTPYRGDTENHWAMYYASLYLITQMYPNDQAETWFNGRSAQENFEEAREYLIDWIDLTTTKGQGEFDSPRYLNFYIAPVALLYAFAEDPAMKQRARMMLDYLIADFAVESLNGLYVGAFSRIYPPETLNRWNGRSRSLAWLVFGNTPFFAYSTTAVLAMSGYRPPVILYHLATDRSQPYVHKELKRTRHRIRYSDVRNVPVYKYTYMSKDYAVGSIQGGLLQPIQQHTWEVFWVSDHPREGYNVLFTLHPYSSPYELAMYFPGEPELLTKVVVQSKTTYDSPDKWTGGSPYEEIFQHEDALIVLYDIPPGTRFPHISGFFPKTLAVREEDPSGWIFMRGGEALIAYYPLAPYEWQEEEKNWRLHSTALKNGAVVQVAPASAYDSFADFKAAVKALPLETRTEPEPHVRFTTLDGAALTFGYGKTPTVNGAPVDYDDWPLFDGPFLHAEEGSKKLKMSYGPLRRLLDFEALTIKDWTEEPAPASESSGTQQ